MSEEAKKLEFNQKEDEEKVDVSLDLVVSTSNSESENEKKLNTTTKQQKRMISSESEGENETKKIKNGDDKEQEECGSEDIEMDGSSQGDDPETDADEMEETGSDADKQNAEEERKREDKEKADKQKENEQEKERVFMKNTRGRLDEDNFIVYMKGVHRNITRVNADRVHKEISEILNRHAHMERAGESLRIFCKNDKERTRMLAQKHIADHEVQVTEPYTKPRTKYSPKGIIFDVDLDMKDDEIKAATSAVSATRILRMMGGQKRKTGQVIVTFEGEELPMYTYMGWRRFRIQTYTYRTRHDLTSASTMGTRP